MPLTPQDLQVIADNHTVHLDFRERNFQDNDMVILVENLPEDSRVRSLVLIGNQITDIGLLTLLNSVKLQKSLRGLALDENQLTEEGIGALIANRTLSSVSVLGNADIRDSSVKALDRAMRQNAIELEKQARADFFYNLVSMTLVHSSADTPLPREMVTIIVRFALLDHYHHAHPPKKAEDITHCLSRLFKTADTIQRQRRDLAVSYQSLGYCGIL